MGYPVSQMGNLDSRTKYPVSWQTNYPFGETRYPIWETRKPDTHVVEFKSLKTYGLVLISVAKKKLLCPYKIMPAIMLIFKVMMITYESL